MRYAWIVAVSAALVAAAGCAQPMTSYEKGYAALDKSRGTLAEGDQALVREQYDRAAELYGQASRDLASSVAYLEDAERQITDDIRKLDEDARRAGPSPAPVQNRTVVIGSRTVTVNQFYVESLRAYREALALAVVTRSLALARAGEAQYRGGARGLSDGDRFYQARQYAAALSSYTAGEKAFRAALDWLGEGAGFINRYSSNGRRLAEVSQPGVWNTLSEAGLVVDRRRVQADAYLSATLERAGQTGTIVDAYRERRPGNMPLVTAPPLRPLPELLRHGVTHPPIPSTSTVQKMPTPQKLGLATP